MHRFTLLGWTWPLARQLAQLVVLVFVFRYVIKLDIPHPATFIFTGLVVWLWFAAGIGAAASSLVVRRHLVFRPRFPAVVLPVVAVAVPVVDLVLALPVLLAMAGVAAGLQPDLLALPALLAVQFALMCGLGWLFAAMTVYVRDVANVVGVGLIVLFYLSPVFYDIEALERQGFGDASLLRVNPMTTLIEAYRAALLDTPWPSAPALGALAALSVLVAVAGWRFFRRFEHGFVDEL